jgi:chromosome segregation ATPase
MDAQRKRIDELERTIQKAETRQEAIETELESLQLEKEELSQRIQEIEDRYTRLLQKGKESGTGGTSAEMTLLNAETVFLSQMRERLLVKIPQTMKERREEMQILDEIIREARMEKEEETERLLALSPERDEEIEKIQNQILELEKSKEQLAISIEQDQNKLDNLITTSVYVKPRLSDEPVAPNVKLIVALGFIGGLFLAVFLAFMAEFWSKNKQKITG